mmetsp:Transcript_130311/g.225306  ORF Transcript_130311/g.225306 Transcript_130311/m.225306 type:complete len:529 (-) Transcript_130311:346-1932(-)
MKRKGVPVLKADGPQAVYWLRTEVFEQGEGAAGLALPASFSLASLLQLSAEVADPLNVHFSEWAAVARKCLGVSGEVAAVLFDTFDALCADNAVAALQGTRDELCAAENGVQDAYRATKAVPFSRFLLFLFLQLRPRNSTLTSPRQDTWPLEAPTATGGLQSILSPTRTMATSARATDADEQLQFVKRHLNDLLALVALGGSKVTLPRVQALGFLLAEGETATKETPFGSLMPFWRNAGSATQPVEISLVQSYLSQRLAPNPLLYPPPELTGKSALARPTVAKEGHACQVVTGLVKTMHVSTAQDPNPKTKLTRIFLNHQANIYLLAPLEHVAIFGCSNCTIILGTVSKMVVLEHCEKVRVVCAARLLRVSNCTDTRVYGCINTRPVVGAGNKNFDLAPYNIHYPTLEHHLQVSGLNPRLNCWDSPSYLTKEKCAGLLPAHLFSSITIPFQLPGTTVCNPCPLPPEYSRQLQRKTATAEELCEQIRKMSASGSEGSKVIHAHFRDWLVTSGNLRQVLDLLHHDEDNGA